jgi:hypothetical protein
MNPNVKHVLGLKVEDNNSMELDNWLQILNIGYSNTVAVKSGTQDRGRHTLCQTLSFSPILKMTHKGINSEDYSALSPQLMTLNMTETGSIIPQPRQIHRYVVPLSYLLSDLQNKTPNL